MPSEEPTCIYLLKWLRRYPFDYPWVSEDANAACRSSEDGWLKPFDGLPTLDRNQLADLITWKFPDDPPWPRPGEGVDRDWDHAKRCIEAALAEDGDLEALDHLVGEQGGIPNWGPAMASAVLMAAKPCRFTVADQRVLKSLHYLGLYTAKHLYYFSRDDWGDYLRISRELAEKCQLSLRDVDRALWAAAGRP